MNKIVDMANNITGAENADSNANDSDSENQMDNDEHMGISEDKNKQDSPPNNKKTGIQDNGSRDSHNNDAANANNSGVTGNTSEQKNGAGNKQKSYPVNRKMLVPSQHKLSITHARIAKIFNELKSLDCDIYPNAAAVLLRVFVELSLDCYASTHDIKGITVDSQLGVKIETITKEMEEDGIMTKHELKAARQMASSQTQNSSVKTFHAYVHNKDFTPIATDLRTAWDDLWTFIEKLWR
jgi:hypothetical protein